MTKLEEQLVSIAESSPLYPKEWRGLPDAPKTLYAFGNTELLKTRKFTIVGSRKTPANALKLGAQIAKDLSEVFSVVTGTARRSRARSRAAGTSSVCLRAGFPQCRKTICRF